MGTGNCIYCGRTLALSELLEKDGKYRCKNDADCLEFQIRTHSPDAPEEPDDLSALVKAALAEAAGRIAAYGTEPEPAAASEGTPAAGAWMAIDLLAAEFGEKAGFRFSTGETGEAAIAFQAATGEAFTVTIAPQPRGGYTLTVARAASPAEPVGLYREFIYKSYPEERREELRGDLAVLLLAFAGEEERRSALLGRFRREIEARSREGGGR